MFKKNLFFFVVSCTFAHGAPIFLEDAGHFYSKKNALFLGKVLIPCAIMANTKIDKDISTFYQENIRSYSSDRASKVMKIAGSNMPITIALMTGLTASYFLQETTAGKNIYNYTINTFRGIVTGLPSLIAGQNLLGGDRPCQNTNSYWGPFSNDHGVSGHAFMGAIPFITAANMTSNPYLKGIFFVASTGTALSRINDNAHFASQIILGWGLAFASCNAVEHTNLTIQASDGSLTVGYHF